MCVINRRRSLHPPPPPLPASKTAAACLHTLCFCQQQLIYSHVIISCCDGGSAVRLCSCLSGYLRCMSRHSSLTGITVCACLSASFSRTSRKGVVIQRVTQSLSPVAPCSAPGAVSVVLLHDRGALTCVLSVQMATPARRSVRWVQLGKLRISAFCRSR